MTRILFISRKKKDLIFYLSNQGMLSGRSMVQNGLRWGNWSSKVYIRLLFLCLQTRQSVGHKSSFSLILRKKEKRKKKNIFKSK